MTFDELNALSVAIRTTRIAFDYATSVVEMVVEPEYGINEAIKGKTFQLRFEDCPYVARNVLCNTYEGMVFITWGKITEKSKVIQLIQATADVTGLRATFTVTNADLIDYEMYFFQFPPSGETFIIVSKKVSVEVILPTNGKNYHHVFK